MQQINKFLKILVISLLMGISTFSFAQTCNERIIPIAPDSRFALFGSEVADLQTGLIWQRCSMGQVWNGSICTGTVNTYTWSEALALSNEVWRLPNIKELASIREVACEEPAINIHVFPNTSFIPLGQAASYGSSWYWSSSPVDNYFAGYVWIIKFDYGNEAGFNQTNFEGNEFEFHVRLVRGGQ